MLLVPFVIVTSQVPRGEFLFPKFKKHLKILWETLYLFPFNPKTIPYTHYHGALLPNLKANPSGKVTSKTQSPAAGHSRMPYCLFITRRRMHLALTLQPHHRVSKMKMFLGSHTYNSRKNSQNLTVGFCRVATPFQVKLQSRRKSLNNRAQRNTRDSPPGNNETVQQEPMCHLGLRCH